MALVGKNGAGKSTLLKIIAGQQLPDSGNIDMPSQTSIGYLPQELQHQYHRTVYEETATAFEEIKRLEETLAQTHTQISEYTEFTSAEYMKLLEQQAHITERLHLLGVANMRADTEKVLKGLGFMDADFEVPLQNFSGGWRMRVELAKLLLQKPDYLLLDEPTNHLDIESILWIEKFMADYPGSIIVISHDQRFLDTITQRTVEIVNGKVYDYPVSYTPFVALREQRREQQVAEKKQQDKFIEHTETLINKFRAKKNKAAFAQTLITKLDKLEKVEIDDVENAKIKFRFPPAPRSGKIVVKTENLHKYYDQLHVLRGLDFELERGEKVAFVGKNGEGKSTFSKIIAEVEKATEGNLEIGYNVKMAYYSQNQSDSLNSDETVFATIDNAATGEMRLQVRSLLGMFLFSGEDVDKKVKMLSGGEKARLALARMMLEPANLLVLDEPTNHLDMRSKEMLKFAIEQFDGAVIVVSHDREFLKGLTDKVYEFKNGNIHQHLGDIYAFLASKNISSLDELQSTIVRNRESLSEQSNTPTLSKQALYDLEKEIKKQHNKRNKIEQEISKLEQQIANLEQEMSDDAFYSTENIAAKLETYNNTKAQLDENMNLWENICLEIEDLEAQRPA